MITRPEVPFSLRDVTINWFTMALRENGAIKEQRVVSLKHNIVGQEAGFNGEVVIFDLEYSEQSNLAPRSVVLKIPTALKNRTLGQTMGLYEKEIRFYRDLQPTINIRTPQHYYSALDVADDPDVVLDRLEGLNKLPMWLIGVLSLIASWFISLFPRRYALLIEDLSDYRLGDQASGCSDEEIKSVLASMAILHGQFWNSEDLSSMTWIAPVASTSRIIQMMYLQNVSKFMLAREAAMSAREIKLVEWLKSNGEKLTKKLGDEAYTLLHGDFRLDNICFDDAKGEILLFDWQTMSQGPSGMDLAYFLSAALPVGTPERKINELLAFFHGLLVKEGVELSLERLRWQYEVGMLATLHRIIPASHSAQLDLGSSRGPKMMQEWLDKTFDKVKNVQLENVLNNPPR